jgi:hypothetical protein
MKYFIMKKILFPALIFTGFFAGCSNAPNRLVGHTFVVAPVSSIFKMKLGMSMATIEHEYESNHEVLITTYIGTQATKKESQPYSFDGSTYKLDNENYDVKFAGDTALFSVNGNMLFRLEQVK